MEAPTAVTTEARIEAASTESANSSNTKMNQQQ